MPTNTGWSAAVRHPQPNADIQRVPQGIRALDVGAKIKAL